MAVHTIEPGALLALVASRPLQFEAALEPVLPFVVGEKTACSLTGKPLPVLIWDLWDLSNHNICIYLYIFVYICIYLYIFVYICIYLYIFVNICKYLYILVYICIYLYVFVNICIYLCSALVVVTNTKRVIVNPILTLWLVPVSEWVS